jgi:hypothetical protein
MLKKRPASAADCVKSIAEWSILNLTTQSKHLEKKLRVLCHEFMWRGI